MENHIGGETPRELDLMRALLEPTGRRTALLGMGCDPLC